MITRSDDPYRGLKRTFRAALIVSLLVHPFLIAAVTKQFDLRRLQATPHATAPANPPEVVTISSAPKHAPRAIAQAQPHPHRAIRPSVPHPKVVAHVQHVPQPQELTRTVPLPPHEPKPLPTYVPPIPQKRELVKVAPGTPEPAPAPSAKMPAPVSPPPHTGPPRTPEPKAVAYEKRTEVTHPLQKQAKYSDAQIAQIESNLTKSIRASQGYDTPLSNVRKTAPDAAAPKHYNMDFHALNGAERYAQGLCDPIKDWTMSGYDYYYLACNVVEPDGSMTRKPLPWPVRFRPRNDPFAEGYTGGDPGPIAMPLPGWHPDRPIDPDFIHYLRQGGYAI